MSLTEFDQEQYDRNRRREGYLDGEEAGFARGKQDDARNMLVRNYPITDIAEITGLSIEDIRALETEPASLTGRQRVSASQKLAGIADVTFHACTPRTR